MRLCRPPRPSGPRQTRLEQKDEEVRLSRTVRASVSKSPSLGSSPTIWAQINGRGLSTRSPSGRLAGISHPLRAPRGLEFHAPAQPLQAPLSLSRLGEVAGLQRGFQAREPVERPVAAIANDG